MFIIKILMAFTGFIQIFFGGFFCGVVIRNGRFLVQNPLGVWPGLGLPVTLRLKQIKYNDQHWVSDTAPLRMSFIHYLVIYSPAFFQNIFKFCTFLPKFSNFLSIFALFNIFFFALFLKNHMHALTFQNRP